MRIPAGKPVTGSNFIGRRKEISQIMGLLNHGQSVVLIAPRRFGKTSLVNEIIRQMRITGSYTTYVDLFSTPTKEILSAHITRAVLKNKKLDGSFNRLRNSAVAMMRNASLKAVINDFEFILNFAGGQFNDWQLLEDSIEFIEKYAVKNKVQMICGFDEFGDIKKLDGDRIIKLFRSKIQHQQQTSYIFSGSYESVMSNLFVEKKSPFHRFARIYYLGYIEPPEFSRYIQHVLSIEKVPAEEKLVGSLLEFTRGHPYYTQLALQQILLEHALYKKSPDLQYLLNEMLIIENSYLEKVWEDIASRKEDIKTILALVRSYQSLYRSLRNEGVNIARSLKSLTGKGLIFRNNEAEYILSDPLLEYWIKKSML